MPVRVSVALVFVAGMVLTSSVNAQTARPQEGAPTSGAAAGWLQKSTVEQWSISSHLALGAAEAMPDAKFQFRAAPGARTFLEQVNHTSGVMAQLLAWIAGRPSPPNGNDTFMTLTTRARALAALRRTIRDGDTLLAGLSDEALGGMVDTEFFGRTSRQAVFANLIGHTNRQYGQFVVYLRLNGIAPPASRQP